MAKKKSGTYYSIPADFNIAAPSPWVRDTTELTKCPFTDQERERRAMLRVLGKGLERECVMRPSPSRSYCVAVCGRGWEEVFGEFLANVTADWAKQLDSEVVAKLQGYKK